MMNKRFLLTGIAAVALLSLAFAWPASYEKVSWQASRAVSNPLPRVAVLDDNYAAQVSFVVDGIDYGDRIWGILEADSVTGAGGGLTYLVSVPLDSLRWADKTLDSLTCGVELSRTAIFLYDELTD